MPDKPRHAGRITTTGLERRALSLAAEQVELRRLVGELGDRNTRLERENRELRARHEEILRHWRGFLEGLGVSSVEELRALLDRIPGGRRGPPVLDLDVLIAERRRR